MPTLQAVASSSRLTAAQDKKEQVSPSLAAIQAHVTYEAKKMEALLESQVLHEYYQEKYGVKK
eukprot:4448357-Pleurochrysis_carterae.AAC.1